jgi:transcriptional regulator of met regulon
MNAPKQLFLEMKKIGMVMVVKVIKMLTQETIQRQMVVMLKGKQKKDMMSLKISHKKILKFSLKIKV